MTTPLKSMTVTATLSFTNGILDTAYSRRVGREKLVFPKEIEAAYFAAIEEALSKVKVGDKVFEIGFRVPTVAIK